MALTPFFLPRKSGLFVRFFVPSDLQAQVGSRYLVRSLGSLRGNAARLSGFAMAVALSNAMERLRQGEHVDLKKALKAAAQAGCRDYTLSRSADGAFSITTDGSDQDHKQALEAVAAIGALPPIPAAIGWKNPPPLKKSPLFSVVAADHVGDLKRRKLAKKTILDSEHAVRLWLGIVGDFPVHELTLAHARVFFDNAKFWPSHGTKSAIYKGLSVQKIISLAQKNGAQGIADWTLKKHQQRLNLLFSTLVENGEMEKNPLKGFKLSTPSEEDSGSPFSEAELKIIFGSSFEPWAKKYPHRWFGPMLGLYSGARVTEIAQLRVEDIETIDGVAGFNVRAANAQQSIKNKPTRRFVPLAQPVVNAGFLDYIEEVKKSDHKQIFPDLPNSTGLGFGRQLSRQFSAYIKKNGITEKGQGFHGFRHTIATELDRAGVTQNAIAALTGHARDGSVLSKFYIDRKTLPDRVSTLAKFSPPVVFPAYTSGQFCEQLACKSSKR